MATIDTLELTSVLDAGSGFPIGVRTHERPPRFLGVPFVLAQDYTSSTAVTGTTAETTIDKTVTIPGGLLGKNGCMRVYAMFSGTNNANSKICKINLGATNISGSTMNMSGAAGITIVRNFANRNLFSANRWWGASGLASAGEGGNLSTMDTTLDTAADLLLNFTVTLAVGTDSVQLTGYRVEIYPSE